MGRHPCPQPKVCSCHHDNVPAIATDLCPSSASRPSLARGDAG
jgi:hypothetical protein